MRTAIAACVLALSPFVASAQVVTREGRESPETATAPAADRVARYAEETTGEMPSKAPTTTKKSAAAVGANVYRTQSVTMSSHASYFRIYDAGRTLITDRDGDGHFSEFKIRFDADVSFGDALVYARLYIRRVGSNDPWKFYHETDDFWIYGESGTDDYYVTTTLDDGFPAGDYEVLIDLYESGYSGVVATIGPYDSGALSYLPLEEVGLDVPFGLQGYYINDVATTLLVDSDRDGYYSRFRITFDPDTDIPGSYVYAIVWVRAQGGQWIKEHTSKDFRIDASGTADAYSFTADWVSGYPTGYYDVQIDLHDSTTGVLVASAGSERPELSRVPLEDQSRDQFVSSPPTGGGSVSTSSREHGGGAVSLWFAGALLGFVATRKWRGTSATPRT